MRTVRGLPECSLPNGRRFAATVTHTCDDEDAPYVENTFVDIAPGRIDVLLRPHAARTTVFSIRVTSAGQPMFPRMRAWFSVTRGRPFVIPANDVSIHDTGMNVRIRGYFDTRFQIQFNAAEITEARAHFTGQDDEAWHTNRRAAWFGDADAVRRGPRISNPRPKTMPLALRSTICVVTVALCGCPLGTPRDHYRPGGHQDTTICISPADDALLFNAAGNGGRDLYLLDLTDLRVTRIAETPDYETAASFSTDGQRIVYAAGVPADRADHIFTIRRDGSAKTQLTDVDASDTSPRFSPDGKKIVFARDKTYNWGGLAANWELGGVICLMDADGSNLRQLTPDDDFAFEPYFSADGSRIVYSTVNGRMSVSVDGSSAAKPIAGPYGAVPSHDEKRIAYSKGKYSPDLKIYIATAEAASETVLTPNLGGCYRPVFTHAGDELYFLHEEWPSGPTGVPKFSVWQATIDGSSVRMLADRNLFDDPLRWKPQNAP